MQHNFSLVFTDFLNGIAIKVDLLAVDIVIELLFQRFRNLQCIDRTKNLTG